MTRLESVLFLSICIIALLVGTALTARAEWQVSTSTRSQYTNPLACRSIEDGAQSHAGWYEAQWWGDGAIGLTVCADDDVTRRAKDSGMNDITHGMGSCGYTWASPIPNKFTGAFIGNRFPISKRRDNTQACPQSDLPALVDASGNDCTYDINIPGCRMKRDFGRTGIVEVTSQQWAHYPLAVFDNGWEVEDFVVLRDESGPVCVIEIDNPGRDRKLHRDILGERGRIFVDAATCEYWTLPLQVGIIESDPDFPMIDPRSVPVKHDAIGYQQAEFFVLHVGPFGLRQHTYNVAMEHVHTSAPRIEDRGHWWAKMNGVMRNHFPVVVFTDWGNYITPSAAWGSTQRQDSGVVHKMDCDGDGIVGGPDFSCFTQAFGKEWK